ncbi:MAG: hypothetical protein ACD_62C00676G0003 [uncultured bacterium]|nr:MAG: hypothetical protein ACD_62C00676G0003 [uncultured bacterium]HLD44249.1 NADH-quinone oxidoreductase subunit A [bacterium]
MIEYLPVLIMFGFAAFVAGVFMLVSFVLGPKKPSVVSQSTYECGVTPTGDARKPVSVKFYLTAILFIVFDVEIIFLYPWAVNFQKAVREGRGWHQLLVMGIFFFLLVLGLFYEWRKGALEWGGDLRAHERTSVREG